MNLEHKFGDRHSTMEVAQNAAHGIDAKQVYLKLLDIYDEDEDLKTAEEVSCMHAVNSIAGEMMNETCHLSQSKKLWHPSSSGGDGSMTTECFAENA
jgi:hypothetical protein